MFSTILALALAVQPVRSPAAVLAPQDLPPPPEQVLAIPDEMRAMFRAQVLDRTHSLEQRMYRLPAFLFDKEGLNLTYDAYATHTVAESFRTRKINCLAFTLLAVALAREAGLKAYPQQIDRVMAWSLNGNVVIQTMHSNAVIELYGRKFMLDILISQLRNPVMDFQITDEHLLALYYGNRAAELLLAGNLPAALAWQEAALSHDQTDATLWNNAGLIQQRMGNNKVAESYFLEAVKLNPRLTTPQSNLIALYRSQGNLVEMHVWQQRSSYLLRHDPFYQYGQGQLAEQAGDLPSAIAFYREAVHLYGKEHLFHFGLARAYFRLGDIARAKRELTIAEQLSNGAEAQIYRAKLDAL